MRDCIAAKRYWCPYLSRISCASGRSPCPPVPSEDRCDNDHPCRGAGGYRGLLPLDPFRWNMGGTEEQTLRRSGGHRPQRDHHGRGEGHRLVRRWIYDDRWTTNSKKKQLLLHKVYGTFYILLLKYMYFYIFYIQIRLSAVNWLSDNFCFPRGRKYNLQNTTTKIIYIDYNMNHFDFFSCSRVRACACVCVLVWSSSDLGWRRIHQWHSWVRVSARLRPGLGTSSLWLRSQPGCRWAHL